jgi:hypothetical protein
VTTLAICSMLIGSALGIRFRVLILLPVIFLGSGLLAVVSFADDLALSQSILRIVVFTCVLQVSYLCAALLRHAVASTDTSGRWSSLGAQKLR